MKNKLIDLNNHLFEQLERLNDEELTQEDLDKEISRAKAMTDISKTIIENGNLALKTIELQAEYGMAKNMVIPEMLTISSKENG